MAIAPGARAGVLPLHLKPTRRELALLREAAHTQGKTLATFILESAAQRAAEIIAEHRHFGVGHEAWERFVAAMHVPGELVPALVALLDDERVA